MSFVQMLNC